MGHGTRGRGRVWRTVLLIVALAVPGTLQVVATDYATGLIGARVANAAAGGVGVNCLPGTGLLFQGAPPAPSGADPVSPLNHTFDAEPRPAGTAPTDHTFETAAFTTGTPPSNFNLSAGTLADWTATGTASVGMDGTNPYARLDTGTSPSRR